MFQVGEKIVCVDADFSMYPNIMELYTQLPKQDVVYTVRERQFVHGMGYRILLEEISNPPVYIDMVKAKVEPAFNASRFRRLSDPQQVGEREAVEEYEEALA